GPPAGRPAAGAALHRRRLAFPARDGVPGVAVEAAPDRGTCQLPQPGRAVKDHWLAEHRDQSRRPHAAADRALPDARGVRGALGPLLLAAASVGFVVLVAAQLWRPLMYDDANFYLGARAVAQTGVPFSNQGWMGDRDDFSQRDQWALWH